MRNARYEFSSCHVEVPPPLSEHIIAWGRRAVADDDLFVTLDDPFYGREDEPHVTALYGIATGEAAPVRDAVAGFGPVTVELGQVDVFTDSPDYDVVVIEAYSDDLSRLHDRLAEAVPHAERYPFYNPHVTVAYVQKWSDWEKNVPAIWSHPVFRRFTCEQVIFSSKDGGKERLAL